MPIESRTRISSRRSVDLEGFTPIERCTQISSRRSVALEGFMPIERCTRISSRSWCSPRGFHARRGVPKKVADLVKNKSEKE
jgi:hypothetical protein